MNEKGEEASAIDAHTEQLEERKPKLRLLYPVWRKQFNC